MPSTPQSLQALACDHDDDDGDDKGNGDGDDKVSACRHLPINQDGMKCLSNVE